MLFFIYAVIGMQVSGSSLGAPLLSGWEGLPETSAGQQGPDGIFQALHEGSGPDWPCPDSHLLCPLDLWTKGKDLLAPGKSCSAAEGVEQ